MGPNARTRLICDWFIAGHPNCALRRHLDRVWDSHADTDDRTSERVWPVYVVIEPALGSMEQVIAAITGPSVELADLEAMLKRLLPAVPAHPRI